MSKKIFLKDIKPGMTVKSDQLTGLVVALRRKGFKARGWPNSYTYYPGEHHCDGAMIGMFKPRLKEKVTVVTGKKRTDMIKWIQRELRGHISDLERDLEHIDLVNSITADADLIK